MKVNSIKLINYRNIENISEEFSPKINLIIGENAQGKTNLIESIYFALTGRSFRARKNSELINLRNNQAYIGINFEDEGISRNLEILLDRNKNKRVKLNNKEIKSYRVENYISLFTPEDLSIIKGSPNERRRFFDNFYINFSKEYQYYYYNYQKILAERNKLLKENYVSKELLSVFNQSLMKYGIMIEKIRSDLRVIMEEETRQLLLNFSGKRDYFIFRGERVMEEILSSDNPEKEYIKKIEESYDKDREFKFTSFGPHVSDFYLYINDKSSKIYSSQGQQRTLILALEFAMVNIWERMRDKSPILLLDDVFSELDEGRRELFIPYIKRLQSFITQTDYIDIREDIKVYKMKEGGIYAG